MVKLIQMEQATIGKIREEYNRHIVGEVPHVDVAEAVPPTGMVYHLLIVCLVGAPPKTVVEYASGGIAVAGVGRIKCLRLEQTPIAQGAVEQIQVLYGAVYALITHRAVLEVLHHRAAPYLIVANDTIRDFFIYSLGVHRRVLHSRRPKHV